MTTHSCLRCQRVPNKNEKYCVGCGAPLQNKCTNNGGAFGESCQKNNDPQAAFCSECGSPTTFNESGLITNNYTETKNTERNDWEDIKLFEHRFFTE